MVALPVGFIYFIGMGYKEQNISVYNQFADGFDIYFQNSFNTIVKPRAKRFAKILSPQAKILDLGSGPGNHAKFFKDQGFEITCLDLSEEMLRLCRKKRLPTIKMDLENLDLPVSQYDGVWAFASLLHVNRDKAPEIIKKIYQTLKPYGLFSLTLKKGSGEGWRESSRFDGAKRWFVYYNEAQIDKLVEPYFEILDKHESLVSERDDFLYYFLRKKP